MLAENIVRSIRAALVVSQAPDAQTAARVLDVVLEEMTVTTNYPPVVPAPQPAGDAPCGMTKAQVEKMIADYEFALTATRQRADAAELKILELKHGG